MHSQHSSDTQVMWNEMVTNQKNNNNRLAWPFVDWKWNQGCSEWFLPSSNEKLLPIGVVSFSFIRGSLNAFEYACDYSHMLWPLQITRSQLKPTPVGPRCWCSPPLLSKHQLKESVPQVHFQILRESVPRSMEVQLLNKMLYAVFLL